MDFNITVSKLEPVKMKIIMSKYFLFFKHFAVTLTCQYEYMEHYMIFSLSIPKMNIQRLIYLYI